MQHPLARDARDLARLTPVRRAVGPATFACYLDLWCSHRPQTPGNVVTTLEELADPAGKSRGAASEWITRLEAIGLVDVIAKKPLRLYVHPPEAIDRLRAAKPPSDAEHEPTRTIPIHPAGAGADAATGQPPLDNAPAHVGFHPAPDVGFSGGKPNIPPLDLLGAQASKTFILSPFDQRANGKGKGACWESREPNMEPNMGFAEAASRLLERDPLTEANRVQQLADQWLALLACEKMERHIMERYAHAVLYEGLPKSEVERLLIWIDKKRRTEGLVGTASAIFNKHMPPKLRALGIPWTIEA